MTRVVQRTPNLGLTLRMQRPGAAAAAEAPALGWWDPDAQSFTRQIETMTISVDQYMEVSVPPRAVVACLAGASGAVTWEATWQGGAVTVPGRAPYSPEVFLAGPVACAVEAPGWWMRLGGVMQLWATWKGTRYGPITLVVTNAYYGNDGG